MASPLTLITLFATFVLTLFPHVLAQSTVTSSTAATGVTPAPTSSFPTLTATGTSSNNTFSASSSVVTTSSPPDVYLNVPTLSVGRIELEVENLSADINLNAAVASLVTINAGVSVSVQKVNITIVDVDAELELIVRLGNLVEIVNRTFESLDLNPLLITALDDVTDVLTDVVAAVDGLLGTITQGGTTLSFIVDNLGNIVQEVTGSDNSTIDTIVGNYLQNMTYTGVSETLSDGLVEKTYSYSPLNALVNIVFNSASQVVQATVVKSSTSSTSSTSTAATTTATTSSAVTTAAKRRHKH